MKRFDVLVIGSGAAGLVTALQLADAGFHIGVLCKEALSEGSTLYAQGGIAAVQSQEDSIESHIQDTLIAGAGLCDEDAVRFTVEHAKTALEWLIQKGVSFTRDQASSNDEWPYHLTREGGHSKRRIIHAEDATGASVARTLNQLARAHPQISIFEYHVGVDVILQEGRCIGLYAYDERQDHIDRFLAKAVLLATGGASRVYLYTSNPAVSSGDGIAMAYRAGCRVANLEFNQFHPTCLYHPQAGSFLITEAMRGEGAVLRLKNGERFMPKFDERAELAPRDIVARAIDHEMKRLGLDCVYLDISHRPASFIKSHFPMIYERCLEYGFDITQGPIPVVPAAHYTCGGVMVNAQGQTDIPGLYAAGEVSYTGLHGANRMASNSLAECLVYAMAASQHMKSVLPMTPEPHEPRPWDDSRVGDMDELILISAQWDEIRRLMWNYVGIVRSDKRLARAQARIRVLKHEVQEFYGHFRLTRDLIELRNLVLVAELMIESAILRKESRGLHYTLDYPESSDHFLHPTILSR